MDIRRRRRSPKRARSEPAVQIRIEPGVRYDVSVGCSTGTLTLGATKFAHVPARAAVVGVVCAIEAGALAADVGELALAGVSGALVTVRAVSVDAASSCWNARPVAIFERRVALALASRAGCVGLTFAAPAAC